MVTLIDQPRLNDAACPAAGKAGRESGGIWRLAAGWTLHRI